MAKKEHWERLRAGVQQWNQWCARNPLEHPDLSGAPLYELRTEGSEPVELSEAPREPRLYSADLGRISLSDTDLTGANLERTNLSGANLSSAQFTRTRLNGAILQKANLRSAKAPYAELVGAKMQEATLNGICLEHADLVEADLSWTYCFRAKFIEAKLSHAKLIGTSLVEADCSRAELQSADLRFSNLVKANFTGADLSEAWVFGSASWHITTERTTQRNLKINDVGEPSITVDSLEAAQFLHLLLSNEQMRHVLDTITAKVVLILGRFSTERKQILDALRTELRNRNYLPVVFDFELPSNQTTMETVSTLSHMARFVIADITDAKSVLQELRGIVSSRPTLPVQPILLTSQKEPGMFDFFRMFPWVLETYMYKDLPTLLTAVDEHVIEPAERKANEQILRLKQFRAT